MASDAEALRTHVVRAGHDQLRASVVDVLQQAAGEVRDQVDLQRL
jgi:hypothetical protein